MSLSYTLSTIFEIAVGGFIIWGLFNEGKLAAFEKKLFAKIKSYFSKPRVSLVSVKAERRRHCA
ncbi:MAG: hypothetical protein IJN65_00400 [Clostridia bacterium]|nr:hypothetical protein [Clostridia bacterium]